MVIITVVVIIALMSGIVFVSSKGAVKHKTREDFLQDLIKHVEGKFEPLADPKGACKIRFTFENKEFVYEDTFSKGFSDVLTNKVFFKIQTLSRVNLSFTERRKNQKIITGDIVIASQIKDEGPGKEVVKSPKGLEEFEIHTNSAAIVNRFLRNEKVAGILMKFKNHDQRGQPSMLFKMINGEMIFEFDAVGAFKPSLAVLKSNIALIENYLDAMCLLVDVMESSVSD